MLDITSKDVTCFETYYLDLNKKRFICQVRFTWPFLEVNFVSIWFGKFENYNNPLSSSEVNHLDHKNELQMDEIKFLIHTSHCGCFNETFIVYNQIFIYRHVYLKTKHEK